MTQSKKANNFQKLNKQTVEVQTFFNQENKKINGYFEWDTQQQKEILNLARGAVDPIQL